MTTRILPREDWGRLAGTELESAAPFLQDEDAQIIVVEDEGRIVGCWAVIRYVHVEGIYVAPEYRRTGSVARRLLRAVFGLVRQMGAKHFLTAAIAPEVEDLAKRIGGVPLPEAKHFVVKV